MAVTDVNKEIEEATADTERIQHKAFDDVHNAHEATFNHCLWKVLHLYKVSDPSVFDINKDVYEGELVLIDDILEEDVAPSPERPSTLVEDPQAEDEEQLKPRD